MKTNFKKIMAWIKSKLSSAKTHGAVAGTICTSAMTCMAAFAVDDEVTISTVTTTIGAILTSALSWAGSILTTITGNPLLLFFVVAGFIYVGVTLLRRLMHI